MAQIGHKPTGNARGVGEMLPDRARVTRIGSFSQATWITKVGARMGRSTGTSTTAKIITYNYASSSPTTLVHQTANIAVSAYMPNNDPAAGLNYEVDVTGLLVSAGQVLAGGIFNDGPGSLAYGQDNSGAVMFFDTVSAVPDPYNEDSSSAQGQHDIWYIGTTNRQPTTPTIVAPASGEVTVDVTPTVRARFADPDIALGDHVAKYLVEVWDEANTTRLQTSGVLTTDSTMKSTGIIEHTLTTLTPGVVTLRIQLYDKALVPSPTLVYQFQVNSGGAFVDLDMAAADAVGNDSNGSDVTNSTTPRVQARWTHDDATSTATVYARIRNLDTAAISRAEKSGALVVADDGTATIDFDDLGTTWTSLPRGATRYAWELKAIDALGGVTDYAQGPAFVVNDGPIITTASTLDGTSVTTRPQLSMTVYDGTDSLDSMTALFEIGPAGGPYTAVVPSTYLGDGIHAVQTTAADLPTLGDYEWRGTITDPWGLTDTVALRDLHYVAPPAITDVVPADTDTITTGTPTISATVDRTIAERQVYLVRTDTGATVYDSGEVAASGTTVSQVVPGGLLLNHVTYELHIWILAADGLEAESITTFTLEYVAPIILEDVTYEAVHSSVFDQQAGPIPEQKPNVLFSWSLLSTDIVSDEDFLYLVMYRLGGDQPREWRIYDRTVTQWEDTTAPGDVPLMYFLGYVMRMNDGADEVESDLVMMAVTVDIRHTVITSENADDPAVTMHTWRTRSERAVNDVQVVEILGQQYPDTWHSPLDYGRIDGEWAVFDAVGGIYTAQDAVDVMNQLRRPVVDDATGKLVARTLYYRDPQKRCMRFVVTSFERDDMRQTTARRWSLSGVQVDSESIIPDTVNEADAVDGTAGSPVVPLLALVPYASRDRLGEVTPSLSGSARIVDTDRPAPEYDTGVPDATNMWTDPYTTTAALYAAHPSAGKTVGPLAISAIATGPNRYWSWYQPALMPVAGDTTLSMRCRFVADAPIPAGKVSVFFDMYADAGYITYLTGAYEYCPALAAGEAWEAMVTITTPPGATYYLDFGQSAYQPLAQLPAFRATVANVQLNEGDPLPFVDPRTDPHAWFTGESNASISVRRNILPASKNYSKNPMPQVTSDLTHWGVITWVTVDPVMSIDTAMDAVKVQAFTTPENISAAQLGNGDTTFYSEDARQWSASVDVWVPAGETVTHIFRVWNPITSNYVGAEATTNIVGIGDWQRHTVTLTLPAANQNGGFEHYVARDWGTSRGPLTFWVRNPQVEPGAATPFINPDTDPLASYVGTATDSVSTRERTPSVPAWEVLEATTNHIRNPVAHTDLSNWFINGTSARVTMPGPTADIQTAVYCEDTSGGMYVVPGEDATGQNVAAGQQWTGSIWLYADASMVGRIANLFVIEYGGVNGQEASLTAHVLRQGWNYLTHTAAIVRADRTQVGITLDLVARVVGDHYWLTGVQIENKTYATPLTPRLDADTGLPLPGYAWTGTAHASASTRTIGRIYTDIPEALTPAEGSAVVSAKWPAVLRDGFSHTLWGIAYDLLNGMSLRNHIIGESSLVWNGGHASFTADDSANGVQDADNVTYSYWDSAALGNSNNGEIITPVTNRTLYDNPWGTDVQLVEVGSSHNSRPLNGLVYALAYFARPLTDDEVERARELMDDGTYVWYI